MPPDEALKEQVELVDPPDERETLVGLQDTFSPVDGLVDSESPIVPESPPRLERLIVDEPFEPSWKPTVDGLDDMEKSATLTVI